MLNFIIAAIGVWQIVLIIALIVLFFGGKKIPELMRGLGKGVGEFKKGMKESAEEDSNEESK
jgi:sec-independent protein translocase protein TatA